MDIVESEQFILTQLIDKIVTYQAEQDKTGDPYSNIIRLMSKDPQLIFNKLMACEADVYSFFSNLTSLQKGFLVPKIEIYRRDRQGNDIPIVFRAHFDSAEYLKYAFSSNIAADINNLGGRQDGAGLKKISITDRNENQSDVNIEVKIDLFFDNVLALANSDFKQLITVPEIRTNKSERDFRIKLVIGWETPIDSSGQVFSGDELNIIEKSNIVYLLNLTTHDINFKDNGNVEITINYQGSTEKTFSHNPDYDLFSLSTDDKKTFFLTHSDKEGQTVVAEYVGLCTVRDALEKQLEILYDSNNPQQSDSLSEQTLSAGAENKLKELEKKKEEVDKKIEELELRVIIYKYKLILNSIFLNDRISCIDVPVALLESFTNDEIIKNEGYLTALETLLRTLPGPKPILSYEGVPFGDADRGEVAKAISNIEKTMTNDMKTIEDIQKLDTDSLVKAARGALELAYRTSADISSRSGRDSDTLPDSFAFPGSKFKIKLVNSKSRKINYITLGDIINTILNFLPTATEADIILGPCKIGDYILNLSQFPISVNSFVVWFTNNVIKTVKKQYFLWDFIKDITNDLVKSNLMGVSLLGHPKIHANIMVSSINSDKPLLKGQLYQDDGDGKIVSSLSHNISNISKIYSYFVLYIYDYNMESRNGDLQKDMRDGIYHFTIGNAVGVLKNASFNKIDFPRFRDMRIVDGQLQRPGSLLKEHYSMNMKTLGSPLFVNGQTLYFDASYLGLLGRKASEQLGLGGYYLVTGVETTISPEGYENSVKAIWNAQRQPNPEEITTMVLDQAKQNNEIVDKLKQGNK